MRESISIIIPAYNASGTLRQTVASLRTALPGAELVIADDGSLDDTRLIGAELADVLVTRPCQSGAARARNDACRRATGDVFLFVDADVIVTTDAVEGLLAHLDTGADGAFGAYTPLPPAGVRNATTDYKNLIHHFTHLRTGTSSARTFWSGFGVITREAFLEVGGFSAAATRSADVEDIHLGYRLHAAGFRVVLDPRCQVQHHKRYTLVGLARSDVVHRAIPWVRAMVQLRTAGFDLNLREDTVASSMLAWTALGSIGLLVVSPSIGVAAVAASAATWTVLNRSFLRYARQALGPGGALRCGALLAAFCVYAPLGAGAGLGVALLRGPNRSIRNSLSLDLLASPPAELEVTVAIVPDATGRIGNIDSLPDPEPWLELLVVAPERPTGLPPHARFVPASLSADPGQLMQIALEAARGAVLALLDGSLWPQPGWLDHIRTAAGRGDLVMGGAFEHDRGTLLRRAAFLAYLWDWRPERRRAWIGDHPPVNAAYHVVATRLVGGFTTPGALLWRLSGFGALPVRFEPEMRVAVEPSAPLTPLRDLFHLGRLRGAALVRYYDNGPLLRMARVGWTVLGAVTHPLRLMATAIREGSASRRFWTSLPPAAAGLAWRRLGEATGYLLPGRTGGPVSPPEGASLWRPPPPVPEPVGMPTAAVGGVEPGDSVTSGPQASAAPAAFTRTSRPGPLEGRSATGG